MMKAKLFGLAVIAASALAGPAMAQAVVNDPGRCAAQFPNANCKNLGPGNPYTDGSMRSRARHVTYRGERDWDDGWNRTRSGFWPADAAAGIAGAAVGTAGAIATAPFRSWDNSYAYDNGYRGWDQRSYAQRNGFVCTPGTWFKGEDGRRHICQ
jgi:hypothetical protein